MLTEVLARVQCGARVSTASGATCYHQRPVSAGPPPLLPGLRGQQGPCGTYRAQAGCSAAHKAPVGVPIPQTLSPGA